MFSDEGTKEAREAAKQEAGASRAASAAEEIAERVGSVLDDLGEAPAAEKPAEEKPAAEAKPEAKPEAEKPAAEAKPAEAPAGEKPATEPAKEPTPMVPLGKFMEATKERQDLQREKERLEAELAAAKAKPAEKPKAPEDPEPDAVKHPIEHDEWEKRDLKRQIGELRTELGEQRKVTNEVAQARQLETVVKEFDRMAAATREVYAKESPEFNDKRQYVREVMMKQLSELGIPPLPQYRGLSVEQVVDELEREMIGTVLADQQRRNINDPRAPFKRIEVLAGTYGYDYWKASQAAKPAGTNGSAAKPKTAEERIKAGAKLEAAAKTTSTMPGTSPNAPADDVMTAEKLAEMTPAARRLYKKQHPEALAKIFGAEENEGTIF
jgi:hypothetical protein